MLEDMIPRPSCCERKLDAVDDDGGRDLGFVRCIHAVFVIPFHPVPLGQK
jgi:hypothetical protein